MFDLIGNLGLGFATALSPANLLLCFVGVLVGTLIGVLPGVGPIATIAMLMPLTFKVDPTGALIMLAGIYYGAQYGGSTTAILVNIPGEATSVVTALDGHAMARKGQAGIALGIAAIRMASGPATISPSGRTASPNATTPASTRRGPRIDHRPSGGPSDKMASTSNSVPSKPSNTAKDLGSMPGPIPPNVPIGRAEACQNAKPATAMMTRPPAKSCRNHMAVADRDGLELSALTSILRNNDAWSTNVQSVLLFHCARMQASTLSLVGQLSFERPHA